VAEDSIELERVRVRYDRRDGAFRLTSSDSRLKGRSFRLTLSKGSDAVDSLMDVFEEEGILSAEDRIPTVVQLRELAGLSQEVDEYSLTGQERPFQDSRLVFSVGQHMGGAAMSVDLSYSPHTLITGKPGTGKTQTLRIFLKRARELALANKASLLILNSSQSDGSKYATLAKLTGILKARIEILQQTGARDSRDYEARVGTMAPLFVFVDGLDRVKRSDWLPELLSFGETVGIYLFATVNSVMDIPRFADDYTLLNIGRRIEMGLPSVGSPGSTLSKRLFDSLGRGTIGTNGFPAELVQFADLSGDKDGRALERMLP